MDNGVAEDPLEARKWLQEASDQSFALAQSRLESMMALGEGGDLDISKGLALIQEAPGDDNSSATNKHEKLAG